MSGFQFSMGIPTVTEIVILQEVWFSPVYFKVPRWIVDPKIRKTGLGNSTHRWPQNKGRHRTWNRLLAYLKRSTVDVFSPGHGGSCPFIRHLLTKLCQQVGHCPASRPLSLNTDGKSGWLSQKNLFVWNLMSWWCPICSRGKSASSSDEYLEPKTAWINPGHKVSGIVLPKATICAVSAEIRKYKALITAFGTFTPCRRNSSCPNDLSVLVVRQSWKGGYTTSKVSIQTNDKVTKDRAAES